MRISDWSSDVCSSDLIEVDLDLNAASPSRYDGLMLPGGTLNADTLRTEPRAITFIKDFFDNDKPVPAICHPPWFLVEAGVATGNRLPSLLGPKADGGHSGCDWVGTAA